MSGLTMQYQGDNKLVDDMSVEELRREVETLRRRVAEMEVPARRYRAIFDGGAVSIQLYDPTGRTIEVNKGWEELWGLRIEVMENYRILQDPQVVAAGFMDRIERAFLEGHAQRLPTIRYEPNRADSVAAGNPRWVAANLSPVKDTSGKVIEVIMLHINVGELKQSEEELRLQNDMLESRVAERTTELRDKLRLIEEQQRAIQEMSTPVLRVWDGVLALALVGRIDAARASRIMDGLLEAIVQTGSDRVVIDITGVFGVDSDAANHLLTTVRAAELLGAQCSITGISAETARTLVELGSGFEGVSTWSTLQEGLLRAIRRR